MLRLMRWRSSADAATRPTALELGWQGVLDAHRSGLREAAASLEAALVQRDAKALTPIARLWAMGHLLQVLDALDEQKAFATWRATGTAELKEARANGFGSIPYLLEEAYFYAAAGAAREAVSDLAQIVALGARLPRTALDEPRLASIRHTPEFQTFLGSLTTGADARQASARVLPWRPTVAATRRLVEDPYRDLVPRALPGPGNAVAQVPDGTFQGS